MQNGDSAITAHLPSGQRVPRMISLVLLLSIGAIVESTRLFSLRNPEIWGHLQVGNWILSHNRWPRVGLFSQAANLPWRDYSWGYDVVVALAYQLLGLRALPALQTGFSVALAGIAFLLAGGHRGRFWSAVVLSAVAQLVLSDLGPVAAGASIVLFGVELFFFLEIRRSGNLRLLIALPVLFLVWANLDLGFVYGIGLYAVFLVAQAVEKMSLVQPTREIPLGAAALAGGACVLTSLVNPYGYHAYAAFFSNQFSAVNRYLPDYTAMSFHQPRDYALLLLTMVAFLWMGVRRSRDVFQLGVLIICAALAFHAQAETWLATLAAVSVIGETSSQSGGAESEHRLRWNRWTLATAGATIGLVFLVFAMRIPHEQQVLLARIADNFPVSACEAIRQHQLPAPLFNSLRWGSFLIWYLPEYPAAIDGRWGLYPEEEEVNYFKVMNREAPYQSLPSMKRARTLLLERQSVMSEALRGLPGFQVAYEDSISIVLLQEQ